MWCSGYILRTTKKCENFKYAEMSKRISSYEEKTLLKKSDEMAWNELKRNYEIEVQETLAENDMKWVFLMFVRYLLSLSLLSLLSVYIVIAQFMTCLA